MRHLQSEILLKLLFLAAMYILESHFMNFGVFNWNNLSLNYMFARFRNIDQTMKKYLYQFNYILLTIETVGRYSN